MSSRALKTGRWLLPAAVLLAGCTLGPDYERPDLVLPQSAIDATKLSDSQYDEIAYWWTRYHDPKLNALVDDALDDNLDIALQAARLRQARAQLGLAEANLFPSIAGQARATRQRSPTFGGGLGGAGGADSAATSDGQGTTDNTQSDGQAGTGVGGGSAGGAGLGGGQAASSTYNYFSVAATLSYELDVFGGLRRAEEAARARLLASIYTQDSIRLSVVSDVVTNYMALRAAERQIRVTHNTIDSREKALELDQKRFEYGAISKLPLLQTRTLLQTAKAQLPPLKRQVSQLRASLAILTGQNPRQIMDETDIAPGDFKDIALPDALPAVLPSALIQRRPDIRAAEATLMAANANVGIAKARFFPSFNLSAMLGSEALQVENLFQSGSEAWSLSGAITAPIFDFGRRQARYETAKARKQAATVQYRQTVRQAFREVHDALAANRYTKQRYTAVKRQLAAYSETLRLARIRYKAGRTSFFDVLDAQRQLFGSQLDMAEAIRNRFTATADLFKALGGGWTQASDSLHLSLTDLATPRSPTAQQNTTQ